MPFTHWHAGPGLAFKAGLGRRMGLVAFLGAQVLADAEVLLRMRWHWPPLHGFTHTFVGAVVVGAAAALAAEAAWWIGRRVGGRWRWARAVLEDDRSPRARWAAALAGGWIGSFSHVVLDAVIHDDVAPFWPVSEANPFLGLVHSSTVQGACFWAGVAGAVVFGIRVLLRRFTAGFRNPGRPGVAGNHHGDRVGSESTGGRSGG